MFRLEDSNSNINSQLSQRFSQIKADTFQCPLCSEVLKADQLDSHDDQCQKLQQLCLYCDQLWPNEILDEHQKYCSQNSNRGIQKANSNTNQQNQGNGGFTCSRGIFSEQDQATKLQEALNLLNQQQKKDSQTINNIKKNSSQQQLQRVNLNEQPSNEHFSFQELKKTKSQIQKEMEQINRLLDQGGNIDLGSFGMEDHDFSCLGGLNDEQIKSLTLKKFDITKSQFLNTEHKLCCICQNDFIHNENQYLLPCIHYFHCDCIQFWLKKNTFCPLCKKDVKQMLGN